MMPDDWVCDCLDSNIRRVDSKRPHPAINRDGWFCMGCLTEYFKDDDWLAQKLDELQENAIQLRQSAIEKGNDYRERYCLGLIDAIRTVKTEIYLHNPQLFNKYEER